jgi:hypothetical protein
LGKGRAFGRRPFLLSFGVFEGVERLSLGYHDIDNHLSVGVGSDATVLVRAVMQKIRTSLLFLSVT